MRRGRVARLQLQRREDRACLRGPRPRSRANPARRADLAASYQRAIVDSLLLKLGQALERTGAAAEGRDRGRRRANSELRARVAALCDAEVLELKIPPHALCTDNAAMIASAARYLEAVPYPDFLGFDAFARAAA